MSGNSASNFSNHAHPNPTLGQDNQTAVQEDNPTMVGSALPLQPSDQRVDDLLSQRLPKMMEKQFGTMVNEQLHPMMDKLFEAQFPKYNSTIENHVRSTYFNTATTRIIDTLKPFIQETINQAVQPRFPGLFSEPAHVLPNKHHPLISPPPTQPKTTNSPHDTEFDFNHNEASNNQEYNAADLSGSNQNQETGTLANNTEDSNDAVSVNSTMPHPPSSILSVDTTNQLKSPQQINSPTTSNHSSFGMSNTMKTHETLQQSNGYTVNSSSTVATEKFLDVRNRIMDIERQCPRPESQNHRHQHYRKEITLHLQPTVSQSIFIH